MRNVDEIKKEVWKTELIMKEKGVTEFLIGKREGLLFALLEDN